MPQDLRILLVDDNEDFLEVLSMDVEDLGFPTVTALGVEEAFEKIATESIDIIVSDLHMDGKSGMDFIFELREKNSLIPFIFLTGAATKTVAVEALRNGAFDLLEKPIEPAELARVLISAGKLVKRIQSEGTSASASEGNPQKNAHKLLNLRSSAQAFDDLANDSGINAAEKADALSTPSSMVIENSETGETESLSIESYNFQVRTHIQGILDRSQTAVDQLENGQFSRTALSFLCRSYNLVRESAEQIEDHVLANSCETACNCFSYFRVNPKSIQKAQIEHFKSFNKYLLKLNSGGVQAMRDFHLVISAVQAIERSLDSSAA